MHYLAGVVFIVNGYGAFDQVCFKQGALGVGEYVELGARYLDVVLPGFYGKGLFLIPSYGKEAFAV